MRAVADAGLQQADTLEPMARSLAMQGTRHAHATARTLLSFRRAAHSRSSSSAAASGTSQRSRRYMPAHRHLHKNPCTQIQLHLFL